VLQRLLDPVGQRLRGDACARGCRRGKGSRLLRDAVGGLRQGREPRGHLTRGVARRAERGFELAETRLMLAFELLVRRRRRRKIAIQRLDARLEAADRLAGRLLELGDGALELGDSTAGVGRRLFVSGSSLLL